MMSVTSSDLASLRVGRVPAHATPPTTSTRQIIVASLIGNVMEWYDFAVYGYFAVAIGTSFFPANDPVSRADRAGSGRLEQLFTRNAFFIACFSGTVNLSAEDRDRVECCWAYAAAATPVISAQSSKALVRAAGRTHCRPSICFATRPWLTMIPQAASISSIIRRLSGKRKQSQMAWLMTSGGNR
jgi:hypothetical protein